MIRKSIFCFSLITCVSASNISAAEDNMFLWCIDAYPTKIEWCKKQYTPPPNFNSGSPLGQEKSTSRLISNDKNDAKVEAINAKSKNNSRYVLFTKIRQSGNVICAADGAAWAIAEHNGKYYAVNGLARGWSTDMNVYVSEKWHKVFDAGIADSSIFTYEDSSKIIETANDLCPTPKENFIDVLSSRIREGQQRALELGYKYKM